VDSLVADATARVESVQLRQVVRRILPREARILPVPVVLALVLALAPPMPLPAVRLPDFSSDTEESQPPSRARTRALEDRSAAAPRIGSSRRRSRSATSPSRWAAPAPR
jgi:hypothetical protein